MLAAVVAAKIGIPPVAADQAGADLQRRIDLGVWNSPARDAMTPAAEMLTAMRLGIWDPPAGTATGATTRTSGTEETAGDDVRVNDVLGDLRTPCTTQSETTIRGFGQTLVAAFNDSAEGCTVLDSYAGYAYSSNGGDTWTDGGRVVPPEGGFVGGDPSLAVDRQGRFYLATLAIDKGVGPGLVGSGLPFVSGRSMLAVSASDDGGRTWSEPVDGTSGLVGSHDKELLAVDNSRGPHDGNVYLVWTDFVNFKGIIRFSRSTDRGKTFSEPIPLSLNNGYNQGAVVTVGPEGEIYVVWQTQRTQSPAIFFTASHDGGQSFTEPVIIRTVRAPGQLGGCPGSASRNAFKGAIRTLAWPVVDVDRTPITDPQSPPPHRGTIYVAYAAKTGADDGDVFLIRSTDRGVTWNPPAPSPGIRVNDDATTNDQFFPAIAATTDGEVALAWHDRRGDPANVNMDLYAARSTDGGATWSSNVRVTDVSSEGIGNRTTRDPGVAECYMGDYNQIVPFGESYAVVWGDNRDQYPAGSAGTRSDPNVYFDRVEI